MTVPLLPIAAFFNDPSHTMPRISPTGSHIAFLAPWKDRRTIWIRSLDEDSAAPLLISNSVNRFRWGESDRQILFVEDNRGDENFRLYSVDLNTHPTAATELTPFSNVRASLLDIYDNQAIVAMNLRDKRLFDIHQIDTHTGRRKLLAENPGDAVGWKLDRSGVLRLCLCQLRSGEWEIRSRSSPSDDWSSVRRFDYEDQPSIYGFLSSGDTVWIGSSQGSNFKQLSRLDLTSGKMETIDFHPESDLLTILTTREGDLLAALYRPIRLVAHCYSSDFEKSWKVLLEKDEGDPLIVSRDHTGDNWIVSYTDPQNPGSIYHYSTLTGRLTYLFAQRPWLRREHLAPMVPLQLRARDGIELQCLLTLPVGVEPNRLPLVVLVHGGPASSDEWGYGGTVQLLANRLYAVLQVNYRGSTNHGKSFRVAGWREFGRAMQDDLVDAISYVVDKGIADPHRIAMCGFSFGGYAALMGLATRPDLFAAGISCSGPVDLVTLTRSFPTYTQQFMNGWHRYIGDPDNPSDRGEMEARSPVNLAGQIRAPVLIGQGARDIRVPAEQSDAMARRLQEQGVEVTYVLREDEGHTWMRQKNRLDLFTEIERFLSRNLGGRQTDESPAIRIE